MSQPTRAWRVRVAFEPNRFAAEQLITAYEYLKPTTSRRAEPDVVAPPVAPRRATVTGGIR
jgi:hypothetical protein